MSAARDVDLTPASAEVLPHHVSGARSYGWWGMAWLIATEAMLFAALLASYLYIRFKAGPEWPPPPIHKPTLVLPGIMSAILWASSIPVHIADRGIRRGDQKRLRFGLLAALLLGGLFLGLQVGVEFPEKFKEFSAQDHAYGSLFYTIVGMHGIHVLGALMIGVWTLVRAWRGSFTAERHVTVQNFAMYWHFVDVVWLFVVLTIYVSPHL